LTSPDTFIKTRDAVIEADRVLYPTDSSKLDSPGLHEALIWQVFASHEMGINADTVVGGRQTISTQVPKFAYGQAQPEVPQNVVVEPASSKSLLVSWQPVSGAIAYEVFKRKIGTSGQRQFAGSPWHKYVDGDSSTTGWSHVTYVTGATSYEDTGRISEFFAPTGLSSNADADGYNEMMQTEYAVRALAVNPNNQVGVSDLSAETGVNTVNRTITTAIKTTVSNVQLANGVFEFDQTLKNNGVTSVDGVAYGPIDFRIMNISDPSVTVKNADNGGNGRTDSALFRYNQSLTNGATSSARHLQFNNPLGRLFTFDTIVTATLRVSPIAVSGSQPGDGVGEGLAPSDVRFETHTETYNGTLVAGSGGLALLDGLDYVDVPFVAPPNSLGVDAALDATPVSAGALPDMDFQLLDDQDNVLATSGNVGPKESLSGAINPGRTYRYRVVGYAHGPTQFVITSKQYYPAGQGPGAGSSSGSGSGSSFGFLPAIRGTRPTRFARFTFNPLTRAVTFQLLN